MSIELSKFPTSPKITVSAPGGLELIMISSSEQSEMAPLEIGFDDFATLVQYFLTAPEYSSSDIRHELLEKIKRGTFVPGRNHKCQRLVMKESPSNEDN